MLKTKDYREAVGGGGDKDDFFSLAYQWVDKPHRLVYDLCDEIDRLRKVVKELRRAARVQLS